MPDLHTRLLILQLQQQQLVMQHVHLLTQVALWKHDQMFLEPDTLKKLGARLDALTDDLKKLEAHLA